jgi:hypothetical protein
MEKIMIRHTLRIAFVVVAFATPAFCQLAPPPPRTLSLSGPRFGVTALSPGIVDALRERQLEVKPIVTQFGWQAERQFFTRDGGVTALNEWVLLLGGLDQGVVIPSLTWLVGLRSHEGMEFGIGPNVTPGGVALALAAGMTVRAGAINVPINIAVVPSEAGIRMSFLTGFTLRK